MRSKALYGNVINGLNALEVEFSRESVGRTRKCDRQFSYLMRQFRSVRRMIISVLSEERSNDD